MKACFFFANKCDKFVTTGPLRRACARGIVTERPAMKNIQRKYKGFSLVELLTVVAVVAIMMAALAPSISGFSSSAGRRGAVNSLMNTFEQARVAALEVGRPVYVVFWRRVFPEYDAFMVVREPEDITVSGWKYEQLTKWRKMPKNILFHQPPVGQSILSVAGTGSFSQSSLPNPPALAAGESINVLGFNESGAVSFPAGGNRSQLKLIVSEGVRGNGGTEAMISSQKLQSGGFEIISFSRFTGRSQLDVTAVSN